MGGKLNRGPLQSEVIVAQIDRDAMEPRTNLSGNSGMMTKTSDENFLRAVRRTVCS